jgi:F0F1-type ATP synthase epsilon subunit
MKQKEAKKELELHIMHPCKKEAFSVSWFEVKTPTGEFVVSRDHLPLVSIIKDRTKLQYERLPDKKVEEVDIYGGFLKIQDNVAIIVVDL